MFDSSRLSQHPWQKITVMWHVPKLFGNLSTRPGPQSETLQPPQTEQHKQVGLGCWPGFENACLSHHVKALHLGFRECVNARALKGARNVSNIFEPSYGFQNQNPKPLEAYEKLRSLKNETRDSVD